MTNISSLKTQAELALAKLTEGKHYNLREIKDKLQKVAATYPQDTVINAMSNVVEQLYYKKPDALISQGDIERLYNDLVGLNVSGTRFREVLGDLLLTKKSEYSGANEAYIKGMRDSAEKPLDLVNKKATNTLTSLFDHSNDKYDPKCAEDAKKMVKLELMSLGFNTNKIKLAGGNSKFLVFAADLDTNRGCVRIYIPTDASGKYLPSTFIVDNDLKKLNKNALDSYLIGASKNRLEETKNNKIVEMPRIPTPQPLKTLASEIENNLIEATVNYPKDTVNLSKKMIVSELNSMGFKNSQVKVLIPTDDGFICEATLNTPKGSVKIEIPIEIKSNFPLLPSVFAKGDYIADFNSHNLNIFASSDIAKDNMAVSRQYSDLDSMNIQQLKEVILKSALNGDFDSCTEALAVIGEKTNESVYKNAIADYNKMLLNLDETKKNIKASYDDSDQFVKTPNSIYPIHKKLGKPAHELIKDANGVYHLKATYLSRKINSDNGVLFNTAKILLGE